MFCPEDEADYQQNDDFLSVFSRLYLFKTSIINNHVTV